MIPKINLDAIMSDPLLLTAAVLIIIGPLVFLVATVQFFRTGRKKSPVSLPHEEIVSPVPAKEETSMAQVPSYIQEIPEEPEPAPLTPRQAMNAASEKTVVMPAGMGEVQGQLEIAFTQIKTLNKKIAQLESELESLSRNAATKLEANELKEVPMNPADFTQKLLKLAEHVIVLEKEVARMKSTAKTAPTTGSGGAESPAQPRTAEAAIPSEPAAPRPPIMPI